MNNEIIKEIVDSLIYALNSSTNKLLIKRLVVEEFIASLNRKWIIKNEEAKILEDYALSKLSNF
jgi:hypothetical protein